MNVVPSGVPVHALPEERPPLASRSAGVLLHLSSLAGPHAIGELGPCARAFVDALADASQRLWQMLPVCALGAGSSPYSSVSSFAGEPRFISLGELCADGLLRADELPPAEACARTDYARAAVLRSGPLARAHQRFSADGARFRDEYAAFVEGARYWLDDFAVFEALRRASRALHMSADGFIRARAEVQGAPALAAAAARVRFEQFVFARQWQQLRAHAAARGVALMGDLPIFVDHHSADVAAHTELFKLRPDGSPRVVSGVPPDYFSETGQRWGTPVFDGEALAREQYRYFVERFRVTLARFALARIDHFIGFVRAWEIPAADATAVNGTWVGGPGEPLFRAAAAELGPLPFVAEDLGAVSREVIALRDTLGFPGMRILQFAFDGDTDDPFLPHHYPCNAVAYTGTHDNDTWLGFMGDAAHTRARRRAELYLGAELRGDGRAFVDAAVRALYGSPARTVILPLQDVLAQGREARMNVPGTTADNFVYRAPDRGLAEQLAALAPSVSATGRGPSRAWPTRYDGA